MHEVKVFDATGNLKKVISVKALNKRTDKQINSPSFYNKKGRKVRNHSFKKVLNKKKPVHKYRLFYFLTTPSEQQTTKTWNQPLDS